MAVSLEHALGLDLLRATGALDWQNMAVVDVLSRPLVSLTSNSGDWLGLKCGEQRT